MAKKVVATLKTGKGKEFSKVIKMVKSPITGSYSFKEEVVHNDHIKDFLEENNLLTINQNRQLLSFERSCFYYYH
ncbi:MAG: DUF4295 domain-containing protein [Bacteroidetes bacterium]|nr:DUF4295 domain-containing protein [Bacteroidota bacterium]